MRKRFTDCDIWNKEWFQNASPKMKCAWIFLCGNCSAAGVWEINMRLLSFQVGEEFETREILEFFGDRIEDIGDGKWLLPGFVVFQNGMLTNDCRPHRPIISELERRFLHQDESGKIRVSIPYRKGTNTLEVQVQVQDQVKVQVQDQVKVQAKTREKAEDVAAFLEVQLQVQDQVKVQAKTREKAEDVAAFAEFYQAYPYKAAKKAARSAWMKLAKAKTLPSLEILLAAVETQKKSSRWLEGYIPHPATWINGERWNDEITPPSAGRDPNRSGNIGTMNGKPDKFGKTGADYAAEDLIREKAAMRKSFETEDLTQPLF